jgi:hypothetical protein
MEMNQVKLKVYERTTPSALELDLEQHTPDWKLIGNISHTNQRNLLSYYTEYYHDAVLSGNGQVLAIGTSEKESSTTKIITTYKWNATIDIWDVMEDKGGLLPKTQESPCTPGLQECIALSDDGTVLAVSSKLDVKVYSWKANKSAWIPRDIAFVFNKSIANYDG